MSLRHKMGRATRMIRRIRVGKIPQVVSHPRSGTHLLLAYLAQNFYPGVDLSDATQGEWGHWADRQYFKERLPFGLIPSTHGFPAKGNTAGESPTIYIFRDGRAVVLSLWKSAHFMNPEWAGISFSDFLRRNIDWVSTPGIRSEPRETAAAHWARHVAAWHDVSAKACCHITYEDLVADPEAVLGQIAGTFDFLKPPQEFHRVSGKVGIAPNLASNEAWRDVYTDEDNDFFLQEIGEAGRRFIKP